MIVPHSFFMDLLKNHKKMHKYKRWVCLSFTDENSTVNWCPNAGCNFGVARVTDSAIKTVQC